MPITIKPTQLKYKDPSTSQYVSIVAAATATNGNGYESVFYGLAEAAGDNTQSVSSNAVGIYTNNAKTAIQNMLNVASKDDLLLKVDKTAIDNTGITESTYTTVLGGEFTVTTVTDENNTVPHARASVTGRFDKRKRYRITVNNGTPIIIETRLWFEWTQGGYKIFEYLGNINKYDNNNSNYIPTSQTKYPTWLIISDLNDSNSIDIWTASAGTYTFLIEEVVDTFNQLPRNLVYGSCYEPILTTTNGGSTYTNFSIGVNKFTNYRGNIAIGYANIHSGTFSITIGDKNEVAEGGGNYIIGYGNETYGYDNCIHGISNTIRGNESNIVGNSNFCKGNNSYIEGYWNAVYASCVHAEGIMNTGRSYGSHVEGIYNVSQGLAEHISGINAVKKSYPAWEASFSYNIGDIVYNPNGEIVSCKTANSDSTFTSDHWGPAKINLETIGNGIYDIYTGTVGASSNARLLDWDGNEYLNGTLYINCNADSSGGVEVATKTNATSSTAGLMSSADKTKLDGIPVGTNLITTSDVMTGATSSANGTSGLVPAPTTTDVDKFLAGDGTYKSGGLPMVILSYGSSTWADFEAAYNNNVIVYCRASSNSNPATGSQTRMAFMAYVNDATTPTNVEFQYYRSMSSHSATAMGDQVFVYKLDKTSGWSVTTRDASIKEIKAGTNEKIGVSWSSNVVTLSNTMTADDMPMSSSDATTVGSKISGLGEHIGNKPDVGANNVKIRYGVATIAAGGDRKQFYYGITFTNVPTVILTPVNNGNGAVIVVDFDIQRNYCVALVRQGTITYAQNVHWIAIGI